MDGLFVLKLIVAAAEGFLIGSFSMSIIISKYFFKDDVRNHGSGNAGATNVARTFGWVPGIITFLCDFAKCFLAMELGRLLCGDWGFAAAGITCLIGHCFPLYFGFHGGKAVSTGACVALLIDWRLFIVILVVFFLMALITKIVSLSSITAAAALMIATPFVVTQLPMMVLSIFTGIFVIIMHWPNIRRLVKGEEKKFKAGSSKYG